MTHYLESNKFMVISPENMVYEVHSYETFADSPGLQLNLRLIGGRDGLTWYTAKNFPVDAQTDTVTQYFLVEGMYAALKDNGYTAILELPAELKEVMEAEENQYSKYHSRIMNVCHKYGYTQCNQCPLRPACIIERRDNETQTEYTERWERAMTEEYKRKFPND